MKLIDWKKFKSGLYQVLNIRDNQANISSLYVNFEKLDETQKNHPFTITNIKEKGFVVKIYGLFGFISFYHMPWQYSRIEDWQSVFPYLKGKILFGKTYKIDKENHNILLDGEIPQFKQYELSENKKYKGIIINKTIYGVFVELGFDFKWECGSIVGLLHKSNFENEELFNTVKRGDIVEVFFWGYNENLQIILGQRTELKEWVNGKIESLIGTTLSVNVKLSESGEKSFLAENKYMASLPVNRLLYPINRSKVKKAIKHLKNDDIIHCKLVSINRRKRTLQLKWEMPTEIEEVLLGIMSTAKSASAINDYKQIRNRINTTTLEMLELIGKEVKVKVVKKEDKWGRIQTRYFVENKYNAQLIVSNSTYKISDKEKKQIVRNLKDGEIIAGEVLDIENNVLKVKWLRNDHLVLF